MGTLPMKTSRLFSSFMIAALLFVIFHDFAINKAQATQSKTHIASPDLHTQQSTSSIAIEHQSFHQPFLIEADISSSYTSLRESALHQNETEHSQYRSSDIFSPPKA